MQMRHLADSPRGKADPLQSFRLPHVQERTVHLREALRETGKPEASARCFCTRFSAAGVLFVTVTAESDAPVTDGSAANLPTARVTLANRDWHVSQTAPV